MKKGQMTYSEIQEASNNKYHKSQYKGKVGFRTKLKELMKDLKIVSCKNWETPMSLGTKSKEERVFA